MGKFLNPNNSAFQRILNSEIYIDKSMFIAYTNRMLNTEQAFICNSRPRRFGKSVTANMLTAYYSKGCDSAEMFSALEISKSEMYEKHLNKYDVIHFDVQWCCMDAGSAEKTVSYINENMLAELTGAYPQFVQQTAATAYGAMSDINEATGNKFIVIIDEWDFLIRDEAHNKAVQEEYINFLRGMFKGIEPAKYTALAYLTGILPIKRIKTQSALNNFDEYTMLDAGELASYTGFTENEVAGLCKRYNRDFESVKLWYDGYLLNGEHIYNPKAVVSLMLRGTFQSYWSKTGTFQSIRPFIDMNFDGLKTAVMAMLSGDSVHVRTNTFMNDMVNFRNKNDVLTLLIHLGYLAYDQEWNTAYIPNEEIRAEFADALEDDKWEELNEFEMKSDDLLQATLDINAEAVAAGIEKIYSEYDSVIKYNDENSLSSVLTLAYLSSMCYYFRPVRELPIGRGFADFVFIPKPRYTAAYPALVIELKWNEKATTALQQIKEKHYTDSLVQYTGNILLVGINYDKAGKKHTCVIEKLQKNDAENN